MKPRLLCGIFIFISFISCADGSDLLDEYKLLYTDLVNAKTYGYKSFYSWEHNKAVRTMSNVQGSLQSTNDPYHFALMGEGFFKIRLENDKAGYTRNGVFHFDTGGNFVTMLNGYPLYDNICLDDLSFFHNTLRINTENELFIKFPKKNDSTGAYDLQEIYIGKLKICRIPIEALEYYKENGYAEGIYVIKEDTEHTEEEIPNVRILQKCLEMSNVQVLPVVLRMYYILNIIDDNLISNIELKKEFLKIQIEAMANDHTPLQLETYSLINSIYKIISEHLLEKEKEKEKENEISIESLRGIFDDFDSWFVERHLNDRYSFLFCILPFLQYDY